MLLINLSNVYNIMRNYKHNIKKMEYNVNSYWYIKIWIIAIILISLIYIAYVYFGYGGFDISYFDSQKREYLQSITPAHPPPLVHFMDPPNLFSQKYTLEQIT